MNTINPLLHMARQQLSPSEFVYCWMSFQEAFVGTVELVYSELMEGGSGGTIHPFRGFLEEPPAPVDLSSVLASRVKWEVEGKDKY